LPQDRLNEIKDRGLESILPSYGIKYSEYLKNVNNIATAVNDAIESQNLDTKDSHTTVVLIDESTSNKERIKQGWQAYIEGIHPQSKVVFIEISHTDLLGILRYTTPRVAMNGEFQFRVDLDNLAKIKELTVADKLLTVIEGIDAYSLSDKKENDKTVAYNFIFGEANGASSVAAVYTHRLNPTYYQEQENSDLYVERIFTTLTHEFGHLVGFPDSSDKKDVMFHSKDITDTDEKATRLSESQNVFVRFHIQNVIEVKQDGLKTAESEILGEREVAVSGEAVADGGIKEMFPKVDGGKLTLGILYEESLGFLIPAVKKAVEENLPFEVRFSRQLSFREFYADLVRYSILQEEGVSSDRILEIKRQLLGFDKALKEVVGNNFVADEEHKASYAQIQTLEKKIEKESLPLDYGLLLKIVHKILPSYAKRTDFFAFSDFAGSLFEIYKEILTKNKNLEAVAVDNFIK
jgi:hypothetical protein